MKRTHSTVLCCVVALLASACGEDWAQQAPPCNSFDRAFAMEGTRETLAQVASPLSDRGQRMYGIKGRTQDGKYFWFRRQGDVRAGNLMIAGTHDVSTEVNHLRYIECASEKCEAGPEVDLIAMKGEIVVHQVEPHYHATFRLGDLRVARDNVPGEEAAGELVGCMAYENGVAQER